MHICSLPRGDMSGGTEYPRISCPPEPIGDVCHVPTFFGLTTPPLRHPTISKTLVRSHLKLVAVYTSINYCFLQVLYFATIFSESFERAS